MKWNIIIKILDLIHDVLHPFFNDDNQKTEDKEEKTK